MKVALLVSEKHTHYSLIHVLDSKDYVNESTIIESKMNTHVEYIRSTLY